MENQYLQTQLKALLDKNIQGQKENSVLSITNDLDIRGEKVSQIFNQSNYSNEDVIYVKKFTEDVEKWKFMGRDTYSKDNNPQYTFDLLKMANNSSYIDAINTISKLRGFKVKTASALLRFLNPKDFGVVDWRNRAVFELMQKFNNNINEVIRQGKKITTYQASQIFKEVDVNMAYEMQLFYQSLRGSLISRAADIDMALFALSLIIWPMHRH
jgi:hypothetical protein